MGMNGITNELDGKPEKPKRAVKELFPWKKWVATWTVASLIGLYSVFVAEHYWNWLGVPILHVQRVTFLQTLCIMILIGLFTRSGFPFRFTKSEVGYMKSLEYALGLCIPLDKQDDWKLYSNDSAADFFEAFGTILGALGTNTVLLGLGYFLHIAVGDY
jgi:hypothetical protein